VQNDRNEVKKVIRKAGRSSSIRHFFNNLESLTDVDEALYNALLIAHYTLGISSVVMCDAQSAVEYEIQICRDEYYVSIKVICPYFLVLLSECQRLNERDWIGHCFHVTVERFFFLTLDSIAFDHFPLS
jgi:predicted DNA-binding ribbon-helix-helix protein